MQLQTWSPMVSSKLGLSLVAGLMIALSLFMGFVDGEWGFAVLPATAAVLFLLGAFATSVALHDDRVVVRNFGFTSSVPIADITSMDSTDAGIRIESRHGVAIAMAVQKWNLAIWLDRPTRADEVIRTIETRRDGPTN